jgi:hypothetical protein
MWRSLLDKNQHADPRRQIMMQYLRIFPQQNFRRYCYALMAAVFIYSSWCIWGSIFFCTPIAAFWDFSIVGARCLNKQSVW